MRKYYQAALAIIATISLVALLFYRHEYNRLRYVLEVFNYFGRPGEKALQENCIDLLLDSSNPTSLEHANYHFDEPIPSWQRLNDDAYVYSAYAVSDQEIRAVGFARVRRLNLLSCEIYYENELEPIVGNFSYKTIEDPPSSIDNSGDAAKNGFYSAFLFICNQKPEIIGVKRIAGVSFATEQQLLPDAMILPVKILEKTESESNETALCVAPESARTVVASDMTDFISFHSELGVRHFVVYDSGVAERFNRAFKNITQKLNSEYYFSFATVPWNFPFSRVPNDVIGRVVQTDCRYRTYGNVGIVATLRWNEFIVMKYHRTVAKLFRDIDEMGFVADRYKVSTMNLCVQPKQQLGTDDKPIVLGIADESRNVYLYRSKIDVPVVDHADVKTRDTTSDVILVNRYERHCNGSLNLIQQDDPHVGKLAKNIQSSPIYKLFQIYAN